MGLDIFGLHLGTGSSKYHSLEPPTSSPIWAPTNPWPTVYLGIFLHVKRLYFAEVGSLNQTTTNNLIGHVFFVFRQVTSPENAFFKYVFSFRPTLNFFSISFVEHGTTICYFFSKHSITGVSLLFKRCFYKGTLTFQSV